MPKITRQMALDFNARYLAVLSRRGDGYTCKYGHFGCSVTGGGECSDEMQAHLDMDEEE